MSRPETIDKVVIILAGMVAIVVVISVIGIALLKLMHPEADTSKGAELIASMITTVIGALVGFIGGRAYGRGEANGNHNEH